MRRRPPRSALLPALLLALRCGAAAAAKRDASGDALFVMLSAPRSGTEWLRSMLNDHPEICCDGEPLLRLGRATAGRSAGARDAALRATLDAFRAGARDADGVLHPCKKRARARGFKWFDGQAGVRVGEPAGANFSRWLRASRVRILVLERQGLAKHVSDRLKHLSSQLGVKAVPTHCRDDACVARVNAQRVRLPADAVARDLDAAVAAFGGVLDWARATASFNDLLYVRYQDLVDDPAREMRRAYAFLGVDRDHATNASLIRKSVTRPLGAMIENWAEVRAALAGTGWAREADAEAA